MLSTTLTHRFMSSIRPCRNSSTGLYLEPTSLLTCFPKHRRSLVRNPTRELDGSSVTVHDKGLGTTKHEATCTFQECRRKRRAAGHKKFHYSHCPCAWKLDTLPGLMTSLGHKEIEILKLDIEGAEWPVLGRHQSTTYLRMSL